MDEILLLKNVRIVCRRPQAGRLVLLCSITGAEDGQSVIEFVFSLPLLLGMILILVKINTVIQMSIVNQQFARAQALTLTYNSPVYPDLKKRRARFENTRDQLLFNHMVVGVSDNSSSSSAVYRPVASTQNIARKPTGDRGPTQAEPEERTDVRVRSTVTLCTQTNVTARREPLLPAAETGGSATWGFPASKTAKDLDYCGGATRFDPERSGGGT